MIWQVLCPFVKKKHWPQTPLMLGVGTLISAMAKHNWHGNEKALLFVTKMRQLNIFYWHFGSVVWGSSYLLIVTVFEKKHVYSSLQLFIGFAHGLFPWKYFAGIGCSSIITIDASRDNVVLELIVIRMVSSFLKFCLGCVLLFRDRKWIHNYYCINYCELINPFFYKEKTIAKSASITSVSSEKTHPDHYRPRMGTSLV